MHACETPLKRKIFSVRRHLQSRDLPSTYLSSMFENSNVNPHSISMKTKYQKETIVSHGILAMGKDNITETNFCNKFPIKIEDECLGKHIFAATLKQHSGKLSQVAGFHILLSTCFFRSVLQW